MFYERYAELCQSIGESPCSVAEKNNISKTSVTRWKNGAVPKGELVMRLARFFGVSADYLIGGISCDTTGDAGALSPVMIPIVGTIAAGSPIVAEENIEGYAFADIGDSENYFFLRVKGDSMIGAGIRSGALVLIKKQHYAANNQIVACLVGSDSATLKRYFQNGKNVTLMPENPAYQPICLPTADFENGSAIILGVARRVVTDL